MIRVLLSILVLTATMFAWMEAAQAFTAAEQKQLYARCKAKYGKTPANIEIRGRTLVCVYGFDSNASEAEVRAACVKVHGPSVAPRVVKRRGKWTCIVTW
jgi:hypothetical protein